MAGGRPRTRKELQAEAMYLASASTVFGIETLFRRSPPNFYSASPTLDHFLARYGQFIRNCKHSARSWAASSPSSWAITTTKTRASSLVFPYQALAFRVHWSDF